MAPLSTASLRSPPGGGEQPRKSRRHFGPREVSPLAAAPRSPPRPERSRSEKPQLANPSRRTSVGELQLEAPSPANPSPANLSRRTSVGELQSESPRRESPGESVPARKSRARGRARRACSARRRGCRWRTGLNTVDRSGVSCLRCSVQVLEDAPAGADEKQRARCRRSALFVAALFRRSVLAGAVFAEQHGPSGLFAHVELAPISRSSPCAAQDPLSSGLVREERNPGSAESGGRTIWGLGGTTSRALSAVVTLRLNNTVFFRLLSGPPSLLGRLLSGPASLPGRLPPGHGCRPPTRRVLAARQGSTPAPLRCAAANCTRSARRVACGRRPGRSPARGPRPFRRPGERSPARSEKLADALTPTP